MRAARPGVDLIGVAVADPRRRGEYSPLANAGWQYVETGSLEHLTAADWALLDAQRGPFMRAERPRQALEMLLAQRESGSFGYQINNFEHCLQAATLALEDGQDEETVVVALFHDLGFTVCNESHGTFAAALLAPYVDARHVWTLERHMYFQASYCPGLAGAHRAIVDRWRGHDHFEWADMFVRRFDVDAMRADFTNAPLEEFVPMVEAVFSRTPKPCYPE